MKPFKIKTAFILTSLLFSTPSLIAAPAGSCSGNPSVCYEYTSGYTAAAAQNYCSQVAISAMRGTYSPSPCPTTGRIAVCRVPFDRQVMEVSLYDSRIDAATLCSKMNGTLQ